MSWECLYCVDPFNNCCGSIAWFCQCCHCEKWAWVGCCGIQCCAVPFPCCCPVITVAAIACWGAMAEACKEDGGPVREKME